MSEKLVILGCEKTSYVDSDSADAILLEHINELKTHNAALRKQKQRAPNIISKAVYRILNQFADAIDYIARNKGELALTAAFLAVTLTLVSFLAWRVGGWQTGVFYADSGGCYSDFAIRAEYNWGYDIKVGCTNSRDIGHELSKIQSAYDKYNLEAMQSKHSQSEIALPEASSSGPNLKWTKTMRSPDNMTYYQGKITYD